MLIKARFKGQDGSLGFSHNKEYILIVKGLKVVNAQNTKQACIYQSLESFFNNWDYAERQTTTG